MLANGETVSAGEPEGLELGLSRGVEIESSEAGSGAVWDGEGSGRGAVEEVVRADCGDRRWLEAGSADGGRFTESRSVVALILHWVALHELSVSDGANDGVLVLEVEAGLGGFAASADLKDLGVAWSSGVVSSDFEEANVAVITGFPVASGSDTVGRSHDVALDAVGVRFVGGGGAWGAWGGGGTGGGGSEVSGLVLVSASLVSNSGIGVSSGSGIISVVDSAQVAVVASVGGVVERGASEGGVSVASVAGESVISEGEGSALISGISETILGLGEGKCGGEKLHGLKGFVVEVV